MWLRRTREEIHYERMNGCFGTVMGMLIGIFVSSWWARLAVDEIVANNPDKRPCGLFGLLYLATGLIVGGFAGGVVGSGAAFIVVLMRRRTADSPMQDHRRDNTSEM